MVGRFVSVNGKRLLNPTNAMESNTAQALALTDPRTYAAVLPAKVHAGRNVSKASLKFYRIGAASIALKDYGDHSFLVRNTIGRFFARREARAYAAAAGTPGLPAFRGRVGPFALATEWLDATPLSALTPQEVPADLGPRLRAIVEALHARGIAVGDIHHRDVLVSRRGDVHLIDFAAAWDFGPSPGPIGRALFTRLKDVDRVAMARIEARFLGLPEHEAVVAAAGPRAARRHARGRKLKEAWNFLRGRRRST